MSEATALASPWRVAVCYCIALAHLLVLVLCGAADGLTNSGFVLCMLGLAASCIVMLYAFRCVQSSVFLVIVSYLCVAFTLKLPLCLLAPEATILSRIYLQHDVILTELPYYYVWLMTGFAAFTCSYVLSGRRTMEASPDPLGRPPPPGRFDAPNLASLDRFAPVDRAGRSSPKRISPSGGPASDLAILSLMVACLFFLALRWFVLFTLGAGLPSVVTPFYEVENLAGFLVFLSTVGAVPVYVGTMEVALRSKSRGRFWIAVLLFAAYALVNLAVGWRTQFFVLVLGFLWLALVQPQKAARRRLLVVGIGLVVLLFLIFRGTMSFRAHTRPKARVLDEVVERDLGDSSFVRTAQDGLFAFWGRLNGIDAYFTAAYPFQDRHIGLEGLAAGDFGKRYTHEVMGMPRQAVTAMGSTIWGFWGAHLGPEWLLVLGIILGVLCRVLEGAVEQYFAGTAVLVTARICLALFMATILTGSGEWLGIAKQAFVVVLSLTLVRYLAGRAAAPITRTAPQRADAVRAPDGCRSY